VRRLLGRVLGALVVLMALALPRTQAEAAPAAPSPTPAVHLEDGGACGEAEQEELVDCGARLERSLGEPVVLSLLRTLEVRMSERACNALLEDIWSQQQCAADGRECGKMNSGAPPGAPPKLASSSSSARSSMAGLGLGGDPARRLGPEAKQRAPKSRDLQPPLPPPKL
jgi:hypothetical protein